MNLRFFYIITALINGKRHRVMAASEHDLSLLPIWQAEAIVSLLFASALLEQQGFQALNNFIKERGKIMFPPEKIITQEQRTTLH